MVSLDGIARLEAYTDGSYNKSSNKVGFGVVLIGYDTKRKPQFIIPIYGDVKDPTGEIAKMHNVGGEIAASFYAMQFTNILQKSVYIYYDYLGVEKWATGDWKCNKDATKHYASSIRKLGISIGKDVKFRKVDAHTGVLYNELADRCAKLGSDLMAIVPDFDDWSKSVFNAHSGIKIGTKDLVFDLEMPTRLLKGIK